MKIKKDSVYIDLGMFVADKAYVGQAYMIAAVDLGSMA